MKMSEYDKLHEHYLDAEQLLKHINSLRHLIQGAEKRIIEGTLSFHLYARTETPNNRRGKYDHGVDVNLPMEMLRDAMLPVLKAELDKCLLAFRSMPFEVKGGK